MEAIWAPTPTEMGTDNTMNCPIKYMIHSLLASILREAPLAARLGQTSATESAWRVHSILFMVLGTGSGLQTLFYTDHLAWFPYC